MRHNGSCADVPTVFWCCSLTLTILDWRNGKSSRPRDPPFVHPTEQSDSSVYERADDHDRRDTVTLGNKRRDKRTKDDKVRCLYRYGNRVVNSLAVRRGSVDVGTDNP